MSQIGFDMNSLAIEVFQLTGQKIDPTDPVIIAALFQSKILQDVQKAQQVEFSMAMSAVLENVGSAIQLDKAKLEVLNKAQDKANREMVMLARNAMKSELPRLREEFHDVALEVLREANGIVDRTKTKRKFLLFGFVACAVFVCGLYVGVNFSQYLPLHKNIETSTQP
jgi:hypothetical protein